jgi:hypothetical protein
LLEDADHGCGLRGVDFQEVDSEIGKCGAARGKLQAEDGYLVAQGEDGGGEGGDAPVQEGGVGVRVSEAGEGEGVGGEVCREEGGDGGEVGLESEGGQGRRGAEGEGEEYY